MKQSESTFDLSVLSCQQLDGVGKKIAERLAYLGIHCVQDILFHLPLRYQDRTRVSSITNIVLGEHVVVEGEIESAITPAVGKTKLLCRLQDETGQLTLRFFYANAFQRQQFKVGTRLRCFGEVRRGPQGFELIHPECQALNQHIPAEKNLTPIYPTTEGLHQFTWRNLTEQALMMLKEGAGLHEILPKTLLDKFIFPSLEEALSFVHRPPSDASVDLLLAGKHISQKRLVFEELLAHRLSLLQLKQGFQLQLAFSFKKKMGLTQAFLQNLPFTLTKAQLQVLEDIYNDLAKPHPMLRLVQGDVGSGKTVVAALAILQAIENGFQAAVIAPTELLAEQHFQTFSTWFTDLGLKVVLLSGSMKTALRRETLSAIAEGSAHVILGTHAIFQKDITFLKLALIVVDEQHRFGVEQRSRLREKGIHENYYPHQLIMTATPIPRTLAMSVYADLDCSVIDELPPGRLPISTLVISNARRSDVLQSIEEACRSGRQVYWVCTLIEESETLQCQAAQAIEKELKSYLTDIKIGLIHGRMKAQDKEIVMMAFKRGDLHLLVATTVIEVGVDVPNASLMVIENAERLGLAQLHQLRGRIGRGNVASHCILLYQPPLSLLAKERLQVMRETTDGFKIAQRDLELRGPGEVLGTRQTGDIALKMADLLRDSELLPDVEQAANILLQNHSDRVLPLIKRWLRNTEKYGHV